MGERDPRMELAPTFIALGRARLWDVGVRRLLVCAITNVLVGSEQS